MKIIFSNINNNTNARNAAFGLAKSNLLAEYHTTIAVFQGSIWDHLSRIKGLSEIERRRFDPILKSYVKTNPWREIGRHLASKAGLYNLIRHETGLFNIDTINRKLDQRVAANLTRASKKGVKGVYSYEDIAVHSFRQAKLLGLNCLYDLPIGYWREAHRLLEIEREAWPEWASTLTGFKDSEKKLSQKDEELELADEIFVASTFTSNSLKAYPGSLCRVHLIPYGFPTVREGGREYPGSGSNGPLKLLFVGGLSQRKGIANLFAAVENLGNRVNLTVVGNKGSQNCRALDNALSKHKWIPTLPHEKVLELMRESDVLVFPSLFEGFGLVMTEAMSQGTPVITTNRTAGPDIITDGVNGWLIEAGSTKALREKIEELLIKPQQIAEVGKSAKESARNWTWEDYGTKLTETIEEVI